MNTLKIVLITVIIAFYIIIMFFSVLNGKALKTLFFNAFLGVTLLFILNLTSVFTKINVPINVYTVSGGGMFGIPMVICFAILNNFII